MKFTVYKIDLIDAMKCVVKSAAVKPQTPILASVLLEATKSKLTMSTTNFKTAMQMYVPVSTEVEGRAAVDAKFFLSAIGKLPEDTCTLETSGNTLTVRSGSTKFDLLTFDADNFPRIDLHDGHKLETSAQIFKSCFTNTLFAAAKDTERPLFQAVSCNFKRRDDGEGELTTVATNTHRIAVNRESNFMPTACEFSNVNVPAEAMKIFLSTIDPKDNGQVFVDFDGRKMFIRHNNVYFTTRLTEGEFPNTDRLINAEKNLRVEFNVAELKDKLSCAAVVANNTEYRTVTFSFGDGSVDIMANSPDVGTVADRIELPNFHGDLTVSFNVNYLTDFLAAVNAQTIVAEFDGALEAARFTEKNNPDFIYIVTPVRT